MFHPLEGSRDGQSFIIVEAFSLVSATNNKRCRTALVLKTKIRCVFILARKKDSTVVVESPIVPFSVALLEGNAQVTKPPRRLQNTTDSGELLYNQGLVQRSIFFFFFYQNGDGKDYGALELRKLGKTTQILMASCIKKLSCKQLENRDFQYYIA